VPIGRRCEYKGVKIKREKGRNRERRIERKKAVLNIRLKRITLEFIQQNCSI
jgi:hypothetical protein